MDYPLLNIFVTMSWFFLWGLWLFLLFRILTDLFRDDTLSGWSKAGWSVLVILLPALGVLLYLIVRGHDMGQREAEHGMWSDRGYRAHRREADSDGAVRTSGADELAMLADLRARGQLTEEEYQRVKAKVIGSF